MADSDHGMQIPLIQITVLYLRMEPFDASDQMNQFPLVFANPFIFFIFCLLSFHTFSFRAALTARVCISLSLLIINNVNDFSTVPSPCQEKTRKDHINFYKKIRCVTFVTVIFPLT